MSYQKLFDHMHREHDLILVDSELSDIAVIVREMDKDNAKRKINPKKIPIRIVAVIPVFLCIIIFYTWDTVKRVYEFILYGGEVKINNQFKTL